jgi:hypothetical protein
MDIPPDNPNTQKEKPRRYFSLQNFSTYFDNLRVVTVTSPRKEKESESFSPDSSCLTDFMLSTFRIVIYRKYILKFIHKLQNSTFISGFI